jgi:serpin B
LLYHPDIKNFKIGSVIQKARISVAEWGTEAGAATAVMIERTAAPGQTKMVKFFADHPFVYTIAEKSSGVILFAGVYDGK